MELKTCKHCGAAIEYVSTPTRGYWAAKNGRQCEVASQQFNSRIGHLPVWNTTTKDWE